MEVRCKICGRLRYVSKAHKDYRAISRNPNYPYICEYCSIKIQTEMQNLQQIRKFNQYPSVDLDWGEAKDN